MGKSPINIMKKKEDKKRTTMEVFYEKIANIYKDYCKATKAKLSKKTDIVENHYKVYFAIMEFQTFGTFPKLEEGQSDDLFKDWLKKQALISAKTPGWSFHFSRKLFRELKKSKLNLLESLMKHVFKITDGDFKHSRLISTGPTYFMAKFYTIIMSQKYLAFYIAPFRELTYSGKEVQGYTYRQRIQFVDIVSTEAQADNALKQFILDKMNDLDEYQCFERREYFNLLKDNGIESSNLASKDELSNVIVKCDTNREPIKHTEDTSVKYYFPKLSGINILLPKSEKAKFVYNEEKKCWENTTPIKSITTTDLVESLEIVFKSLMNRKNLIRWC